MPSRWSPRRTRFREILTGRACVHPASVHDAVSARIAADLGFELGMFAGSVASLAVLGAPDLIVLTLSEFCRSGLSHRQGGRTATAGRRRPRLRQRPQCHAHGGGAGECWRRGTLHRGYEPAAGVRSLGQARVALPRRGRRQDESCPGGAARPRPGDCRTHECHEHNRLEDAIRRAKAYEAAGVDAMFLVGVKSKEQLEAAAAQLRIPIILGGGPVLGDRAYLASKACACRCRATSPSRLRCGPSTTR